ncbi:hypothetical protein PGUG_00137 [Meyerozyma guilliermondii ATCC 6260]|uniref:Peptidase M48 domain-containing protein n=1 Tax=Meyerozyma guilliermondii (strain ATCC 6260 / CBS 566 / DSM 6381 / JCM 1539 / NBRC 10279 / NRRL Y-324) TaxID=294746 RepID=A5DA32_PICGU|nr:uncharacterized protein PGUG_00137 [Meyerozyma guilliermondii ATCC 6260]EDK36039.2 hypothetical protein PGUG_00137 [Meyerozyma guilliermondii ATCC 6260]
MLLKPFMSPIGHSIRQTAIKRTTVKAPNCIHRSFHKSTCFNYAYRRFNNAPATQYNLINLLYSRNTIYAGLGLAAFYVYNLDEAPFTGRLRCIWIPYWLEKKIGDYSYRQILYQYQQNIVPVNDPVYSRISNIMNQLLASAIAGSKDQKQIEHLKSLKWAIHVINDPKSPPNAFILPNGKIFIFSSILRICQNDDGLATVLSHELSHQLAHHSSEQLSKQPLYIGLSTLLYAMTGITTFNDLLINGLLRMPSSREMESEADHIGCELMARSCMNVKESVNFWGRMNQWEQQTQGPAREGAVQQFFSTHPNTQKRVHDIQSWLPDLEHIKESSGCYEYRMFSDASRNFFKH